MRNPPKFDEFIHSPARLRITAALSTADELDFSALQETVGLSTSHLSKQLRTMAEAGYLTLKKRSRPFGRPQTWVRLTTQGKKAWRGHIEALRQLTEPGD
ncbi:transcriptional regulator [Actinomycetaceae bacterium L2_0104]